MLLLPSPDTSVLRRCWSTLKIKLKMRLYGAVSMRSASMMGWALLFVQSPTLVYVTSDLCSERKLNKLICLTTLDFGEIVDLGVSLEHTRDD